MNNYIFRMPESTPPLTYAMLRGIDRIGTTVTLPHHPDRVAFRLYDLTIARIYPDRVAFTLAGDTHRATDAWVTKILADNGIPGMVYREKFVLYAGSQPVDGHTFAAQPTCGHCGAVIKRSGALWTADKPFYRYGQFTSWAPGPSRDGVSTIRQPFPREKRICAASPDNRHEPWCNHDPAAVDPRDGRCECGTRVRFAGTDCDRVT